MKIWVVCNNCSSSFQKENGAVSRARKSGLNIYCSRKCAGLAHRVNRSAEEKKFLKSEYDKEYRKRPGRKEKKEESRRRNYDPVKAAEKRKERMPYHVAYCRRPDYREKKQSYDQQYRAKKLFGDFWEAAIILNDISKEVDNRLAKQTNGLINKSQKRKRQWQLNQNHRSSLPRI